MWTCVCPDFKNFLSIASKKHLILYSGLQALLPFHLLLNDRLASNISKSSETCAATQHMIIYASPCLWVEEGGGTGASQRALVFVRKSCLTICCLPPQHARIWNWSSTICCSQRCGQRESKVTAKDLPQSVMGCGGGLCVTPQLLCYILWVTSTSSLLQNITLIISMPDRLSVSGWILLWLP